MPVLVDSENWKRVVDVIRLAERQGCELRTPKIKVKTAWGKKSFRYLYNPETGGHFDLSTDKDDEIFAPSTLRAMERRLGIELIKKKK